jgi:hypothetical protein
LLPANAWPGFVLARSIANRFSPGTPAGTADLDPEVKAPPVKPDCEDKKNGFIKADDLSISISLHI